WRRQVSDLFADVHARYAHDPRDAHRWWRERRDALFGGHAQSPIPAEHRAAFTGLTYFDYDPRFAFTASIRPLPEARFDVATRSVVSVSFRRLGAVDLPTASMGMVWLGG